MKKILLLLLVVVLGITGYWYFNKDKNQPGRGEKTAPLQAKNHSDAFNNGIDSLLASYFNIKASLVNADSVQAKNACQQLVLLADSGRLAELKTDGAPIYESAVMMLGDVRLNAESLLNQTTIAEMRQDFSMISESLYPLLKTIHYEGATLYWQFCENALGEGKDANWMSNTRAIANPYSSKKPNCGEIKDSIVAK